MIEIPKIDDKVEALKKYLSANRNDEEGDSWTFGHNPKIITHLNSFSNKEFQALRNGIRNWGDELTSNLADPITECENEQIDGSLIYCEMFLQIESFDDLEYLIQNLAAIASTISKKPTTEFYDRLISKSSDINEKLNSNYNYTVEYLKRLKDEKPQEPPTVEIIDLSRLSSNESLHEELKLKLKFPDYYGNNFDALWDMITSGYISSNLVFYDIAKFSEINKLASRKLATIKSDFNKQSKYEIIHNDATTEKTTVNNLFGNEPLRFGLRGDKGLWKELELKYLKFKWSDEVQIFREIKSQIEVILNSSIDETKMIYVKRFAKGGMSSGKVSTKYWLRIGIPTIIARFKYLKEKADNNR